MFPFDSHLVTLFHSISLSICKKKLTFCFALDLLKNIFENIIDYFDIAASTLVKYMQNESGIA